MKTNGLRNKKPQCARAAWRSGNVWMDLWCFAETSKFDAIMRWCSATWRK